MSLNGHSHVSVCEKTFAILLHFSISFVLIVLLEFHFHFSFINLFRYSGRTRKGKGKTDQKECFIHTRIMKYEMIFKQFNIIPPISEMLYNRKHIFHFSQNLSSFVSFDVDFFFHQFHFLLF